MDYSTNMSGLEGQLVRRKDGTNECNKDGGRDEGTHRRNKQGQKGRKE